MQKELAAMVKAIGSICIVVGCSMIGIIANRRLREHVLVLQDLIAMIQTIESEISSQLSSIPTALQMALNASGSKNSACTAFIRSILIGLEMRGPHVFPEIWRSAAEETLEILSDRERNMLNELADKLGRYGAEEQLSALRMVRSGLEHFLRTAEEERSRSGKVYLTLGTALGLALAIILV